MVLDWSAKRIEDAVVAAGGIVCERKRSKCTVVGTFPERRISIAAEEGMISNSGVVNAGDISKERATVDGRVCYTFGGVDNCTRSSGRIEAAGCVVRSVVVPMAVF